MLCTTLKYGQCLEMDTEIGLIQVWVRQGRGGVSLSVLAPPQITIRRVSSEGEILFEAKPKLFGLERLEPPTP